MSNDSSMDDVAQITAATDSDSQNLFLGGAGNSTLTGSRNVALGAGSAQGATSGSRNNFLGYNAGRDIGGGSDNVFIGDSVAYRGAGAESNVLIGSGAMFLAQGDFRSNVMIGRNAGYMYQGSESVGIGAYSLSRHVGGPCTAVGTNAGGNTTTGSRQTLFGFNALGGPTNNDVVAIGHNVAADRSGQIAIGDWRQTHIKMLGIDFARWDANAFNMWLGTHGPQVAPTGQRNLGIGSKACSKVTSGGANIGIGESALELQESQSSNIAIGVVSAQMGKDLSDCTYVGTRAGRYNATGVGATAFGFRALEQNVAAANNTGVGDSAGWVSQGYGNVFVGYVSGEYKRDGDECITVGRAAGRNRLNGDHCILIGGASGALTSKLPAINQGDGTGGTPAGSRIIAVGYRSAEETLGSDVVAIGHEAGRSVLGATNQSLGSVFLGNRAGNNAAQKTDPINCVGIGQDTFTTKDDQVVIGNDQVKETVLRGVIKNTVLLFAELPTAEQAGAGARAFVSDSNTSSFYDLVAGGGGIAVPVFCDGIAWRVG